MKALKRPDNRPPCDSGNSYRYNAPRRYDKSSSREPARRTPSRSLKPRFPRVSRLKSPNYTISTRPASGTENVPQRSPLRSSTIAQTTASLPFSDLANGPSNTVSRPLLLPSLFGPTFTLESSITMTLCGEAFIYDLNNLERAPTVIIELLEATSSERGNWIQVGSHYRRKSNPRAAISVVSTMLQGQKVQPFLI
jgi:hypothetical protein